MEIYLWHFVVYFVFDAIFIMIFNPVLSPSKFYDELFTGGYLFYRALRTALTVICLCIYGEIKVKWKIEKEKNRKIKQ